MKRLMISGSVSYLAYGTPRLVPACAHKHGPSELSPLVVKPRRLRAAAQLRACAQGFRVGLWAPDVFLRPPTAMAERGSCGLPSARHARRTQRSQRGRGVARLTLVLHNLGDGGVVHEGDGGEQVVLDLRRRAATENNKTSARMSLRA
jgi:hypothetical protein